MIILDPDDSNNMVNYTDNPPAYEFVAAQATAAPAAQDASSSDKKPNPPVQSTALAPPVSPPMMSVHGRPVQAMPQATVYHYQNPLTGDQITSLLPPDHPEMICLQQGGHDTQTKFGILGVLAAIFWFPLGVGLCLLDRRVVCRRCGMLLEDGVCC